MQENTFVTVGLMWMAHYCALELTIPEFRPRRRKKRGKHSIPTRYRNPPLPSILLANVQSLDDKVGKLQALISFQRDIAKCNVLGFTETCPDPTVPDSGFPSPNRTELWSQVNEEVVGFALFPSSYHLPGWLPPCITDLHHDEALRVARQNPRLLHPSDLLGPSSISIPPPTAVCTDSTHRPLPLE